MKFVIFLLFNSITLNILKFSPKNSRPESQKLTVELKNDDTASTIQSNYKVTIGTKTSSDVKDTSNENFEDEEELPKPSSLANYLPKIYKKEEEK